MSVLHFLCIDPAAALGAAKICARFSVPGINCRRCGLNTIDRARLFSGTDIAAETILDRARPADENGDITLGTANLVDVPARDGAPGRIAPQRPRP